MVPDLFWLFLVGALALNLTPGPDMAFTLASAARGGAKAGLAAAAGIVAGSLLWAIFTAAGFAALVAAAPRAFDVIRIAGGVYLLYLAWRAFRTRDAIPDAPGAAGLGAAFRAGLLTNLLNPKVGLFFLAFLPGFADASGAALAGQLFFLGAAFSASGGGVLAVVALGAGALRSRLDRSRRMRVGLNMLAATAFGALGLRLLLARN